MNWHLYLAILSGSHGLKLNSLGEPPENFRQVAGLARTVGCICASLHCPFLVHEEWQPYSSLMVGRPFVSLLISLPCRSVIFDGSLPKRKFHSAAILPSSSGTCLGLQIILLDSFLNQSPFTSHLIYDYRYETCVQAHQFAIVLFNVMDLLAFGILETAQISYVLEIANIRNPLRWLFLALLPKQWLDEQQRKGSGLLSPSSTKQFLIVLRMVSPGLSVSQIVRWLDLALTRCFELLAYNNIDWTSTSERRNGVLVITLARLLVASKAHRGIVPSKL